MIEARICKNQESFCLNATKEGDGQGTRDELILLDYE